MKADVHATPPGALSPRQSQKAATRHRVLEAARELFEAEGYIETTIRKIAQRAGVSVGTVFTSFSSKGEILSEVMQARLEGLHALQGSLPIEGAAPLADRLKALFAASHAFEAERTKLFLAHIAATYDWTLSADALPYGRTPQVCAVIRRCLMVGLERGEIDARANIDDAVNFLKAAYAWTYRLAAWNGAGSAEMTAAMDRQIDLLVSGLSPRP